MVKKEAHDLLKAEVSDLRDKLAELLAVHKINEEIIASVDKANGDIPDLNLDKPIPEGVKMRDDMLNIPVGDNYMQGSVGVDAPISKGEDPIDVLTKKGAKFFAVDVGFKNKKEKIIHVKSCSHCGSIMEKSSLEDQILAFDKKLEKEVKVENEQ